MSQTKLLIVSDGLIPSEQGYVLHPLLDQWRKQLCRSSRSWFESVPKTELEWYASLFGTASTDVLAAAFKEQIPADIQQVWIVSPYHAQLGRDSVRVMPDPMLPWREEDADWVCNLLNPLLREEGIELLQHGAALLLICREPMDALPLSFATVSGRELPNRHPDGVDGGRLMRLMAEIQMLLSLKPAEHRRLAGEPDIHGLWIWGGRELSEAVFEVKLKPVATRNPVLSAVAEAKDAFLIISSAEQLPEMTQSNLPLPKQVVLAGNNEAVVLKPSLFPRFGKPLWQPKAAGEEDRMMDMLRGMI